MAVLQPDFETSGTQMILANYPRNYNPPQQIAIANGLPVRPTVGQGWPLGTAK
jgi:hypothetical protein